MTNSRSWNIANVSEYIKCITDGKTYSTSEILSNSDILEEYIMLGLRTANGIRINEIEKLFGKDKSDKLNKAIAELNPAYIHFVGDHLSLTAHGMFVSDNIIVNLLKKI